ncbi:hypothetical protein Bca4012_096100 [Brassica carinata]
MYYGSGQDPISCKVADELLRVGNEPIHEEEEMTIGDCGGRREDSDSAETINSSNGDNGTLDMNEEHKKKELREKKRSRKRIKNKKQT